MIAIIRIYFKKEAKDELLYYIPEELRKLENTGEILEEIKKRVKRVSLQAAISGGYSTPIRLSLAYMSEKRRKAKK